MKITQSHYTFWMEKRTPTPTWAAEVAPKRGVVSVDYLINVQDPTFFRWASVEPHNTISILRSVRRREPSVVPTLMRMAANPETTFNPEKRAAFCRRCLRKLGVMLQS